MCGRYTVNTEDEIVEMREIIQEISVRLSKEDAAAYQNFGKDVFPSAIAPVITPRNGIKLLKWGFEKWDGKGVVFNAKSETIATSKFFSPHLLKGRCIIPAGAYYEWRKENGKAIEKFRIFSPQKEPIFMAGLMKQTSEQNAEYVIITRPAAENISFIHNRMPLIFGKQQVIDWLCGNFQPELLQDNAVQVAFEQVG